MQVKPISSPYLSPVKGYEKKKDEEKKVIVILTFECLNNYLKLIDFPCIQRPKKEEKKEEKEESEEETDDERRQRVVSYCSI